MDAPVHFHGRSHGFPFTHPREQIFLAWCWVIARPLPSRGVVLLSLPSGVGLTGVGLVICPMLGRHPCILECQLLMQWGGANCNVGCLNVHAALSLSMRGCLLQPGILPHKACPPICPWSSSSLERDPPWLGWDHQISSLWHLFSSCSTTYVSESLP